MGFEHSFVFFLQVSPSMLLINKAKQLKDKVNYCSHDVSEVYADYTPVECGFNDPFYHSGCFIVQKQRTSLINTWKHFTVCIEIIQFSTVVDEVPESHT